MGYPHLRGVSPSNFVTGRDSAVMTVMKVWWSAVEVLVLLEGSVAFVRGQKLRLLGWDTPRTWNQSPESFEEILAYVGPGD